MKRLFDESQADHSQVPLAHRLRPHRLQDVEGQVELTTGDAWFANAIAENDPEPEASITQIIYSMAAIDAMREAVKTGKIINVEKI